MKYYYTLHYKEFGGKGTAVIFTNLSGLAKFVCGKDSHEKFYNEVLNHFSRKKLQWYEDPYIGVSIIKSLQLVKGNQRVVSKAGSHSRNFKSK
jgi:hypothetical protein